MIDEVAVHVRLGDYEGLSETFGLLSTDYYSAALDSIGVSSGSRVVVFSNDPIGAKSLLEEPLKGLEVTFKEPADSPVDDLSLMATYRDLIIANSSFSYWAGMLGRNNVYAPDKWFRSLDDPSELHPPYWKLIESAWR